ncbi:DNA-directed RNA polymerase subunit beta [Bacillus sp. ISL-35]|uniref:DNA-directed RNA polymerase subunit beta n=1 Tax=Bacillus sp. ISL-35 TaxID=2819122 RepID=UPI001BE53060|nr:DNA-directed RNA polymerase subunit beta [Bacillus sp. ISL-35]MBT2678681.1 DNA-directed RNA polymerase subunit beta [Bacillus sp. ISL-35]MBT2703673.1 DNA-directed RNA polymerase subunit beta [Chryseobacterium sp. ISL-80]
MALNKNNQEALTREEVKQEKKSREKKKRIRVRLIPIWLRIIIVIILFAASILLGAMFGYAIMGNGKVKDVFEKSTWTHIVDLVNKE